MDGKGGERGTNGDDVGVAHDGVGECERDDNLQLEWGHVAVHGDFFERV